MKPQNSNRQTATWITHALTGEKSWLFRPRKKFQFYRFQRLKLFFLYLSLRKSDSSSTQDQTQPYAVSSQGKGPGNDVDLIGSETINIPEIFCSVHGFAGKTVINGEKKNSHHRSAFALGAFKKHENCVKIRSAV